MSQQPNQPTELDSLRQQAAFIGINLNTETVRKQEARARLEGIQAYQDTLTKSQKAYKWLGAVFVTLAHGAAIVIAGVLLVFGVLLGLPLLAIAEIIAVAEGFAVINPEFAYIYALPLVGFLFVSIFLQQSFRGQHTDVSTTRFSLRIVWRSLLYAVGIGSNWQPQTKEQLPLALVLNNAVRAGTLAVVATGLLGRLAPKIIGNPLPWHQTIQNLITASTLAEFAGYVSAVLMTMALLSMSHFVIHFIQNIYQGVVGSLNVNFSSENTAASQEAFIELATAKMYRNLIANKQAKLQASQPLPIYQNGRDHDAPILPDWNDRTPIQ